MTKTVVGSPAYMAPERLGSREYDSSSDIWSIGIILYEMIYGVNPFKECKNRTMLMKYANTPIDFPKTRNHISITDNNIINQDTADKKNTLSNVKITTGIEKVPDDFLEFMTGMLSIDPIDRYTWDEIKTYSIMVANLSSDEITDFNKASEIYLAVRREAASKIQNSNLTSDSYNSNSHNSNSHNSNSHNSNSKSEDADNEIIENNQIFVMDIDGGQNQKKYDINHNENHNQKHNENHNEKEKRNCIISDSSPDFISESFGVYDENKVDKFTEIDMLEEYFMLNDPNIINLYKKTERSQTKKQSDSESLDYSFLDNTPFLQDDFKYDNTYESLKTSATKIGSIVRTKSGPVVNNISNGMAIIAKKTARMLGTMVSPSDLDLKWQYDKMTEK
jgi:serine/threonine protein kinase